MIIVSFTTIPERLFKNLPENCINSILNQTIKPDYIVLNIPEISKKGELYSHVHAKNLEMHSSVVIQYGPKYGVKDLGPITKLVPTIGFIKRNRIDTAIIILVDDDCIYDQSMIENLITAKKKNPEQLVIGTTGRIKQGKKLEYVGTGGGGGGCNSLDTTNGIYVDIIETFSGALYDYQLFKDKDVEFVDWVSTLPDNVLLADDIVLSEWSKRQGAKLYKIIQNKPVVKHEPKQTFELNIINDFGGNNDIVYEYFEDLKIFNKLIKDSKNNSFSDYISQIKKVT